MKPETVRKAIIDVLAKAGGKLPCEEVSKRLTRRRVNEFDRRDAMLDLASEQKIKVGVGFISLMPVN